MDWQQYIHNDPKILVGKPVVRGTRLAVDFLLGLYAAGWSEAQILENYPTLTPEALRAIHGFAAQIVVLSHVREGGHSFPSSPGH